LPRDSLADGKAAFGAVSEPKPLAFEAAVEAPSVNPEYGEDFWIPLVGVMDLVLPESDVR
jgi:hypothetical protein